MSVPLTVQGITFQYPVQYDNTWGPTLTNWSTAVTNAIKPLLSGGTLQVSPYPGAVVNFANATNTGYLPLAINGSNQLTFNGTPLATSGGGTVNVGTQYQLGYYATSGTAISGLTLITPNKALESDSNGLPIASSVSSTTLAFLDATSSIQTQLNAISSVANAALPKAGGTMSGAINMGSNKITSLANGSASSDAAAFGQITAANAGALALSGGTLTGNLIISGAIINMGSNKITNLTQGSTSGDAIAFPVTGSQMSSGTVTGTQIASSAALAGSPTTTTQSANDSSTKIATTAFVNPANSLASPGYQKFASGLIMQWGSIPLTNGNGTAVTITFPIAFPSSVFSIQAIAGNVSGSGLVGWHIESSATTTSQFVLVNNDSTQQHDGTWLAVGI